VAHGEESVLNATTVTGPSMVLRNRESWPTHRPSIRLKSVFFPVEDLLPDATGLHMGSSPGKIFPFSGEAKGRTIHPSHLAAERRQPRAVALQDLTKCLRLAEKTQTEGESLGLWLAHAMGEFDDLHDPRLQAADRFPGS
jgi:hypothetical protein